jgi:hypothetical protein
LSEKARFSRVTVRFKKVAIRHAKRQGRLNEIAFE